MAVYRIDRILEDVRVALDQNATGIPLEAIGDVDTLSLDGLIKSKVEEAVTRIHSDAPAWLVSEGRNFGDAIYWGDMGSGWVLLPDDFMRLVAFRMDDWSRAVYHAIGADTPEYAQLCSRFKGIRGTPQRPVCALSIRPEGRVLEFYSCKGEEARVSEAVYLPYPRIDRDGGIEICSRCYTAAIYTAASLASTALGNSDMASALAELAKSSLN